MMLSVLGRQFRESTRSILTRRSTRQERILAGTTSNTGTWRYSRSGRHERRSERQVQSHIMFMTANYPHKFQLEFDEDRWILNRGYFSLKMLVVVPQYLEDAASVRYGEEVEEEEG